MSKEKTTMRNGHIASCECSECLSVKGKLTQAEPQAKCGRCNQPLLVRENGGNMCQSCLARMFK